MSVFEEREGAPSLPAVQGERPTEDDRPDPVEPDTEENYQADVKELEQFDDEEGRG